jgi:hypothetical protein
MDSTIIIEKVSLLLQFCANVDGHVFYMGRAKSCRLFQDRVGQTELVLSDCFNRLPMV